MSGSLAAKALVKSQQLDGCLPAGLFRPTFGEVANGRSGAVRLPGNGGICHARCLEVPNE